MESVSVPPRARPASWKWWVCGLLLLASTINYMDRQTLANAAVRITTQFHLSQEQYGNLEWVFGWAFAAAAGLADCGFGAAFGAAFGASFSASFGVSLAIDPNPCRSARRMLSVSSN